MVNGRCDDVYRSEVSMACSVFGQTRLRIATAELPRSCGSAPNARQHVPGYLGCPVNYFETKSHWSEKVLPNAEPSLWPSFLGAIYLLPCDRILLKLKGLYLLRGRRCAFDG